MLPLASHSMTYTADVSARASDDRLWPLLCSPSEAERAEKRPTDSGGDDGCAAMTIRETAAKNNKVRTKVRPSRSGVACFSSELIAPTFYGRIESQVAGRGGGKRSRREIGGQRIQPQERAHPSAHFHLRKDKNEGQTAAYYIGKDCLCLASPGSVDLPH